jgi:hypothetical protein
MDEHSLRSTLEWAYPYDMRQQRHSTLSYIEVVEDDEENRDFNVRAMYHLFEYYQHLEPAMKPVFDTAVQWKICKPRDRYIVLLIRLPDCVSITYGTYPSIGGVHDRQDLLSPQQTESSRQVPGPRATAGANPRQDPPLQQQVHHAVPAERLWHVYGV